MMTEYGHGNHVRSARGPTENHAESKGKRQGHVGQVVVE